MGDESLHNDYAELPWTQRPWLGFDTETTGTNNEVDHVITASLIDFNPNHIGPDEPPHFPVRQGDTSRADNGGDTAAIENSATMPIAYNWIANPGVEIPAKSTAIHGMTTEDVERLGKDPEEVYEHVAQVIVDRWAHGIPIIAFNAGYDLIILDNNLRRHALLPLMERTDVHTRLVIDPLILDRGLDPYRKGKRKLVDLLKHYQIHIPESLHDAEVDTLATLHLLRKMVQKYPQLASMSDEQMLQWQAEHYTSWARGLNKWKKSKGYSGSIPERWDIAEFLGIAQPQ